MIVRSLVDIKGNLSQGIENKIVVFLLSIEEEKLSKNATSGGIVNNPAINLNIIFSLANTPGLPMNIPRLHVEIYNLNMPDTMRLWGAIGTKYIPSCAYRIKQIIFDSDTIIEDIPPILGK